MTKKEIKEAFQRFVDQRTNGHHPYIQSRFEGTRYGTDALLIAEFLETIGVHTNAHRGQNWSDKG